MRYNTSHGFYIHEAYFMKLCNRFSVLLLCLFAMSTLSAKNVSDRWTEFASFDDGSIVYIDNKTKELESFWGKLVNSDEVAKETGVKSLVTKFHLNCKNKTVKLTNAQGFDISGKYINENVPDRMYDELPPDSIVEAAYDMVCEKHYRGVGGFMRKLGGK